MRDITAIREKQKSSITAVLTKRSVRFANKVNIFLSKRAVCTQAVKKRGSSSGDPRPGNRTRRNTRRHVVVEVKTYCTISDDGTSLDEAIDSDGQYLRMRGSRQRLLSLVARNAEMRG